jgi:hypothetical protein
MSFPVIQLLREGAIAGIRFGQSRQSVLSALEPPPSWLGKPPCIGLEIQEYEHSETWFYDDEALGISFNSAGVVNRVTVVPLEYQSPEYLVDYAGCFCDWSIGDVSKVLALERLAHDKAQLTDGSRWILGKNFYFLFLGDKARCSLLECFASQEACIAALRTF